MHGRRDGHAAAYEGRTAALRRHLWNAVAADAFGRLGFAAQSRTRGADVFQKILAPGLAIRIAPDAVLPGRDVLPGVSAPAVYRPRIPFDFEIAPYGSDHAGRNRLARCAASPRSVAGTRLMASADTRSLEVPVRGHALWYEIAISPLERTIQNTP